MIFYLATIPFEIRKMGDGVGGDLLGRKFFVKPFGCRPRKQAFRDFLISYALLHYETSGNLSAASMALLYEYKKRYNIRLYLDCGAFSVWSRGRTVNLDEYMGFVERHQGLFDQIAALDVIAGTPPIGGEELAAPDEDELIDAAERSWTNYQTMIKAGLPYDKLVPCYHGGEPRWVLDRMLKAEAPRIALSLGKSFKMATALRRFNSMKATCFKVDGSPRAKYHIYGTTSPNLLRSFPVYSFDSTGPIRNAAIGRILIIRKNGSLLSLCVTERTQTGESSNKHLNAYAVGEQHWAREYVAARGFSIDELAHNLYGRMVYNTLMVMELATALPDYLIPKSTVQQTFF